jgi:hypothetical protein
MIFVRINRAEPTGAMDAPGFVALVGELLNLVHATS